MTGTADPGEIEHFMSNALPVANGDVYVSPAPVTSRREIYDAHPNATVPAFAFVPGRLATFSAPTADGSPFAAHVVRESEIQTAAALADSVDADAWSRSYSLGGAQLGQTPGTVQRCLQPSPVVSQKRERRP